MARTTAGGVYVLLAPGRLYRYVRSTPAAAAARDTLPGDWQRAAAAGDVGARSIVPLLEAVWPSPLPLRLTIPHI